MGLDARWAIVPFMGEGKMSRNLFRHKWLHLHFLILTAIMLGGGFYLRNTRGGFQAKIIGLIFTLIAMLIYGVFLILLYWRICKTFNKGFFFKIATILLPIPFLFLLGRDKEIFWGFPYFEPIIHNRFLRFVFGFIFEGAFAAVALAVFAGVGLLSTMLFPPRVMVDLLLTDKIDSVAGLEGDGRVVARADMMGSEYAKLDELYAGRDRYFPDHDDAKSVVVLEYIIGSNLEDTRGLASFNIDQMKKATKNGSSLKFVIEAGGSYRWFTKGIEDETVGRYEVADGNLKKVADLDNKISMVESDELYDFLNWAKNQYPADRYMLVLWDHGGGLSTGFGEDGLNKSSDSSHSTMLVDEIVDVLKRVDMKFDLIGFDACLMQNIEIANAFEPYADYYLASQETESGDGWYYTSAFGKLAQDPTISTEDLAVELISSFDLYNAISNDGKAKTETTLSLIDLTRISDTYDALEEFYDLQDKAIRENPSDYADISLAVSNAYAFSGDEQVDLIDYLEKLDESDYNDTIASSEQINELISQVRSTVVYRNAVSNFGINGLAATFPFDSLMTYEKEHKQFSALGLDKTRNFYDDYFSIMAYMKKKDSNGQVEIFGLPIAELNDYTQTEWYVMDFENYADIPSIIDIPLIETDGAYKLDLPDTVWNIVADSSLAMYQKTDKGWRYLGQDVPGTLDENEHPMASTDGTWIHIGNELVAYEKEKPVETPEGVIYKGTVKARLNDKEDILLQIEWEPINEDSPRDIKGQVKGYTFLNDTDPFREKGLQELSPGDSLKFLFDVYDEEGKLIETETSRRSIRVRKMSALTVSDKPLGECDIRYGIRLTDVFQRDFVTDMIDVHIEK